MKPRFPIRALVPAILAVLYGASPLDLIPDLIPLIGFVDDAVIVPVLLLLAIVQYRRYKLKPARIHARAL
jgi:uncharacterized membrane protein YkvA (DUF1232 family)